MHRVGNAQARERVAQIIQRIQGEFREMPGLTLTLPQARRLWGLDETRCIAVFNALVDAKFLTRTSSGAYRRPS